MRGPRVHVLAVKVPRPTRALEHGRANDARRTERLLFVRPFFETRRAVVSVRIVWPMPLGVETAAYLGEGDGE